MKPLHNSIQSLENSHCSFHFFSIIQIKSLHNTRYPLESPGLYWDNGNKRETLVLSHGDEMLERQANVVAVQAEGTFSSHLIFGYQMLLMPVFLVGLLSFLRLADEALSVSRKMCDSPDHMSTPQAESIQISAP